MTVSSYWENFMRRILEIGHGGIPFSCGDYCKAKNFAAKLPPDVLYCGVDLPRTKDNMRAHYTSNFERQYHEVSGSGIALLGMDAAQMAFKDGVFDEAHMHNVVTDYLVPASCVRRMLGEVFRVLKEGGSLIITGEAGSQIFHDSSLLVEGAGFSLRSPALFSEHTIFAEQILQGHGFPEAFMIVGKKEMK